MAQDYKRFCLTIVSGAILWSSLNGCGGCQPVKVVKDFIVEITTEAGKFISQKASTLAEALDSAWKTMFPSRDPNNPKIRITSRDGTKGEYDDDLSVKIVFPSTGQSGGCELEAQLKKPVLMFRKNANDPWDIAPENYPPSFRKALEDQIAIENSKK